MNLIYSNVMFEEIGTENGDIIFKMCSWSSRINV